MSDGPDSSGSREISDLVGVELTLALAVWLLVMLASFFFVGVVVGMILVVVGLVGFSWYVVRLVRRADTDG